MSRQLRLRSLAGIASALLAASCANFTGEAEHTRLERAARAVLPMARVSAAAGQTETAERLYRRLLDLDPESVSARTGLGDLAIDRKKPAEAMRWYEEALERAEGRARSPVLLAHGRAALAAGRIDTARESLTRFVTAEPPPPDAQLAWGYNGLALVAMFEDDLDEAISLFENAAVRAPDQTRIIDNLARARAVLASRPPSPEPPSPPTPAGAEPDAAPRDAGGEDPGATAALPAAPQESALETSEPEASAPPAEPEAPPPAADAIATAEAESTSLAIGAPEAADAAGAAEPGTTPSRTDTAASPPPSPEPPAATAATAGAEPGTTPRDASGEDPGATVAALPAAPQESALQESALEASEPEASAPPEAAAARAAEPEAHPPAAGAVATAEPGTTPSAAEAETPSPQPVTPEKKVPETASDREIAALMRDAGAFLVREGEEWFLQVAAFVKPERAESMAGKIHRRSGVPVKIVRVERNAEPLHLVRVGPVRSRRALRAVLDAFGAGDG